MSENFLKLTNKFKPHFLISTKIPCIMLNAVKKL